MAGLLLCCPHYSIKNQHKHHSRAAVPPGFGAVLDAGWVDIRHWVVVELVVPEYIVGRCPRVDLERAMPFLLKSTKRKAKTPGKMQNTLPPACAKTLNLWASAEYRVVTSDKKTNRKNSRPRGAKVIKSYPKLTMGKPQKKNIQKTHERTG